MNLTVSQEEPGGARGSQEEPGGARGSQEEPGGARRSQEEPGEGRGSQEKAGGARNCEQKEMRGSSHTSSKEMHETRWCSLKPSNIIYQRGSSAFARTALVLFNTIKDYLPERQQCFAKLKKDS
jgi:hypothetical protein